MGAVSLFLPVPTLVTNKNLCKPGLAPSSLWGQGRKEMELDDLDDEDDEELEDEEDEDEDVDTLPPPRREPRPMRQVRTHTMLEWCSGPCMGRCGSVGGC